MKLFNKTKVILTYPFWILVASINHQTKTIIKGTIPIATNKLIKPIISNTRIVTACGFYSKIDARQNNLKTTIINKLLSHLVDLPLFAFDLYSPYLILHF